jgi:signal transduction histidine kinase
VLLQITEEARADGIPPILYSLRPRAGLGWGVAEHAPLRGLTIKAVVVLGFSVTLGVWLVAGYRSAQRMAAVQDEAQQVSARYARAQDLLSTVRAQVLLASVYVRDALLDPDSSTAGHYHYQIDDAYEVIRRSLAQYTPLLDSPVGAERLQGLRSEVEIYYATILDVLERDVVSAGRDVRAILRTRLVPRRDVVIRVSEEVQALNRVAFIEQQRDMAAIYAAMQRRVWAQLGLALALSLAIGLVSSGYASRLERRIRGQMHKEAETSDELQRLSSEVISAQERERRLIARELHDEVGQALSAIKMELSLAERAIDSGSPAALQLIPARTITDTALQTVRDLSRLLHPAILDDLGLPAAIDAYLKKFDGRNGLRVEVSHEGMDDRLPPDVEAAAYRIIQEGVTNVSRHADATTCRVNLRCADGVLAIILSDDGIGFDPKEAVGASGGRGLGLISMRERAANLGGRFHVESRRGAGTRLAIMLPAERRVQEEVV